MVTVAATVLVGGGVVFAIAGAANASVPSAAIPPIVASFLDRTSLIASSHPMSGGNGPRGAGWDAATSWKVISPTSVTSLSCANHD